MSPSVATAVEHTHDLRLIQVDYADCGRAVREYECSSCGAVWFE